MQGARCIIQLAPAAVGLGWRPGILVLAGLLAGLAGLAWLLLGQGLRRGRGYRRARHYLERHDWAGALAQVQKVRALGPATPVWQDRLAALEGRCHVLAGKQALRAQRFEEGLAHFQCAVPFLKENPVEFRGRVIQEMLVEVRRLCAGEHEADLAAGQALLARLVSLEPCCPEAFFWEGVSHLRTGHLDRARDAFQEARAEDGHGAFEPPFYLGMVHLRAGRVPDALRCLAEANRIVADCPLVHWQLGTALAVRGGEDGLAARALKKALEDQGLPHWRQAPARLWREAVPGGGRSFVARLVGPQAYVCPLLGVDVAAMIRQAQVTLAQVRYRQGHFQEAANLLTTVLQDSPPTLQVVRGLGLALARLERYDEAFTHLRLALDLEEPKSPLTAGYLALCAAKARPLAAPDRPGNVAWALRLLDRFDGTGNTEWAKLIAVILDEARTVGLALTAAEQVRWCSVLVSAGAADPVAAQAYDHLAATTPVVLSPEHAWLYCRAAQEHGLKGSQDLVLFEHAFRDAAAGRAYFARHGWDWAEVEMAFLEHWAAQQPGGFPPILGADYPQKGTSWLLARSGQKETAGRQDEALASAAVLLRLAPRSGQAHDRLACLQYRCGNRDQALELLRAWHELDPADPLPLVRLAVIEHQCQHLDQWSAAIEAALPLTQGPTRARVAFLGGRLALAAGQPALALPWLQECLREEPGHAEALGGLAAARLALRDQSGLADMAGAMHRPEVASPQFHYLAALCHLAAQQPAQAIEACRRAAGEPALAGDCRYLAAQALDQQGDRAGAMDHLNRVLAQFPDSPAADSARALLGTWSYDRAAYDEAIACWTGLDPAWRSAWKFDAPLQQTLYLAGVLAYLEGRYHQAAGFFREARRQGSTAQEVAALFTAALVQASNHLLEDGSSAILPESRRLAEAVDLLREALQEDGADPSLQQLLATAYQRQGKWAEARASLRQIARPSARVFRQLGVLALRDHQLVPAVQELTQAQELEPASAAAAHNLLMTHLSLGQFDAAAAVIPRLRDRAGPSTRRLLLGLQAVLERCQPANGVRHPPALLANLAPGEEARLLGIIRPLGNLDAADRLITALAEARPASPEVRTACQDMVILKARTQFEQGNWPGAERLLAPLIGSAPPLEPALQAAVVNLLGCCACLCLDPQAGAHRFAAALRLAGPDPRLYQNQALAHEWLGNPVQAQSCWDRFLELLPSPPAEVPGMGSTASRLAFECLNRQARRHTEKEEWQPALDCLQRALLLQPDNPELLEQLFTHYNLVHRPEEARGALRRLRSLRPDQPHYELYEIDLIPLGTLDDAEAIVGGVESVVRKYPADTRVADRGAAMVSAILPFLVSAGRQRANQLDRAERQAQHRSSSWDWETGHDLLGTLHAEFGKLQRIAGKCAAFPLGPGQYQALQELRADVDRHLERCRALGGAPV